MKVPQPRICEPSNPPGVIPGQTLSTGKMPGHWLLARLGKRVLRPGGVELTRRMLETLNIQSSDTVVEFAPGLGVTTKLVLSRGPTAYIAIERDEAAAAQVSHSLAGPQQRCQVGRAEETALPPTSATVVFGEAMLTMQASATKAQIVQEAYRVLRSGGRYGIHELCLVPNDLDDGTKKEIEQALSQVLHVGVRPLTSAEWGALLESEGFVIHAEMTAPMHLLEPRRLIQDEGIVGALTFGWNVVRNSEAHQRVLAMRRIFRMYKAHLAAIMFVATKA